MKNSNVQITDYQTCRQCQFFDIDAEFSGMSVKIQHNDRQFGVLTGYIKTEFIDEELKDLFQEIDNDLGFGLNDIVQVKEKEQYQARLQESEARIRNIFDSAPDGIFRSTLAGEFLEINDEMARIMGFDSVENAIAHYSDLETKFYLNKNKRKELLRRLDGEGLVKNFTFQARSKDGAIKWLSMNARLDKEKGVIDGFCRDVTKEYAIQKQLEWNEKHLQFIIEGGNLGTYTWYVQTGKTIFNEKWAEMLGYRLEELEPTTIETWKKLTHPEDLEKSIQKIDKLFNREIDYYEADLRLKNKAGRWVWGQDKGKVTEWDEHDKPVKMSGVNTDITLLKKTAAKLKKSEQRYRSLFSNMTTGFALHKIITDEAGDPVDYVYVEVNNAFEKMTGLQRDEVLNKRVTDVLPAIKQDPVDWINSFGQVALKDETLRFENYSESLGKWFDVLAYSPQQCYFATIIDDITLRKETVRKLEAGEKRFREVTEYNYVPMVITDDKQEIKNVHNIYRQTILNARGIPYMFKYADNSYTYLGEGFYELFGIDYGEITFDDVRKNIVQSIVADPDRSDDYKEYVRKFKNGEFDNYKVDLKIKSKSGEIKWAADRAMPIKDGKSGKVIGAMGILQDITEQKQAEEALRKSEERFKLAIEGTQDGLWDWNLRTNYAYHSERFATMLGYEYGELPFTNKAWEDLLHPDDLEMVRQNVENYLKQKVDHYISTFRLRCKDGAYKWITGRGKALFDEKGTAYRFLGFNTDITEQKKSEELNLQLEKQLRKKQKLETLGTLAGGIAHDFNNILTPIMGYSDMAMHKMDKDNLFYDHFNEISRAAFRAKDLVYQMLNFSRQSEQQRTPMNIVPVIKEALKLMRPSIPTTINIKTKIDKVEDKILADATKIHQVIVNLCTNAFQAMEEKGGDLTIELKKVSIDEETSKNYLDLNPGEHLKLSIADTGVGMDAITKERIFEPFFTTKKVNKGTGLGLSVVHGIIQNHEGTITVYSEPDFGTTFNIFLPVFKGAEVSGTPEYREDPFKPGTESILVVDDKAAVTKLLNKMLKALGYQTTVANSSQKGFELFQKNADEYQLLITDLTMPEMTGLELAERIHQIKPDLPVIMVTGYGNRVKQEEKEKAGITKLIGKPILLSEISQAVRNIFDRMKKE